MARQKKFKKMQMPKALEGVKEFLIKRMVGITIVVVSIALVWMLAVAFLEHSDYFRVRSVETRGATEASLMAVRSDVLRHYKDKNIFKVDLEAIIASLEPKYPDAKSIIAKRLLPDKILVDIKFRKPVALLSNGQIYPVDREGVILVNMDTAKPRDLAVIKGIDVKLAGRPHKKNESRSLNAALELLDELKKARFLERYKIRLIDAGDMKSISFYLGDQGPAVIIGYEDFKDRLIVLRDTLRDPRIALDRINYIDVRFKDVAISPK